ncbi:hypothetical protein TRVL_06359 [Trypanosoma vivax]|nr:hypothetical protein TRVL_06359 [Trypanosoma vivax]
MSEEKEIFPTLSKESYSGENPCITEIKGKRPNNQRKAGTIDFTSPSFFLKSQPSALEPPRAKPARMFERIPNRIEDESELSRFKATACRCKKLFRIRSQMS